jgi:ribosome maturation factor RimP
MIDVLREIVGGCASRRKAHLIDVMVRNEKGARVVLAFIDAEDAVTTDLCADISRDVATALDEQNLFDGRYRLEVSSPGADRPLEHPWQYRKHIGRRLSVTVHEMGKNEEKVGVFVSMDETGIVLETDPKNETLTIPFDAIVTARVVTPW